MRNRVVFLTLFALLSSVPPVFPSNNFAANAHKQEPGPLVPVDPSIPLDEKLVYDIFWLGFRVGTGEVWVKEKTLVDGRETFHVVGSARANAFLAGIYPVEDEAQSWIDAETLESIRFEKKTREGSKRTHQRDEFDGRSGKGRHESFTTGEKKTFDVAVPAHDILSAFYWVRRQPLEPDKPVTTVLSSDQKKWTLEVRVLRRQVEELRGQGVVDAFVVEPKTVVNGVPEKRGQAWVYLKNDARRTPVYVKFNTPFGAVAGVLRRPKKLSAP
jgi:hypothetical protein